VGGREILTILFRPEYAEHTDLLLIMMIAGAIQYPAALMGAAATAARFFKPQIPLLAIVIVTIGLSSYWIIPSYGLLGAGFAIVLTSIVLLIGEIILMAWVLRDLRTRGETKLTFRNSPKTA